MYHSNAFTTDCCPRCQMSIDDSRRQEELVVCNNCGFTPSDSMTKQEEKSAKLFIQLTLAASALMVLSFMHIVQWDRHALKIVPLKMKAMTGLADNADLREIVQICQERMKHGCTESTLATLAQIESGNADLYFDLGEIRRKTGQVDAAVQAYRSHFEKGGLSAGAAFEWARIEESRGRISQAQELYKKSLELKPDVLQVTVLQSYVSMLLKAGLFQDAKSVIAAVRERKGPSAQYFMVKEFEAAQKGLGEKVEKSS